MKRIPKSRGSKEEILKIACGLFRARGFEGTTMREIAEKAGMSLGAAYYHFRNKEDLVFEYYLQLEAGSEAEIDRIKETSKGTTERIREAVYSKFLQLRSDRELVRALARVAADPNSPLSPLSPETAEIRERAMKMMATLVEGSELRVGKELKDHLGSILWLYYMLMIFFWAHDRSAKQKRSETLVAITAPLLVKLLSFTSLPMTGRMNKAIADAVVCALGAADEPTGA